MESKEQRMATHKKFMEDRATFYLKPLMIQILKEKPDDILDFMISWCESKGREIQKSQIMRTIELKKELEKLGVSISQDKLINTQEVAIQTQDRKLSQENIESHSVKSHVLEEKNEESKKNKTSDEKENVEEDKKDKDEKQESETNAKNMEIGANKHQRSNNKIEHEQDKKKSEKPKIEHEVEKDYAEEPKIEHEVNPKDVETQKPNIQSTENKKNPEYDLSSSEDEEEDEKDDLERLEKMKKQKGTGKKKMGISAEAYGNYNQMTEFKAPVIEKSEEQRAQIKKTLGMSFMFNNLDPKDFETVIGAMAVKTYTNGEFVIRQGDDGAELFIVGQGSLKCEKLFPGKEEPTFLKNYQIGEVFGELSLMYNAPRAASIISILQSVCFSLDRDTFNNIVKGASMKKRNIFEDFLGKISILSELEAYERSKICDCLISETFKKDELIIKEGEEGNKFYLLQEGTAEAFKTENGQEVKVFEYKINDYFGELALLNDDKRKASIRVTSEQATLASLDKNSFKRLLGPIEAIMQRNSEKYSQTFNGDSK